MVDRTRFPASLWIGLTLMAILVIALISRERAAVEKVPWRTDYNAGMAEAKSANKPVLLDFSTTWCPPCQEMKRTTWSDPGVAAALAGDVPISVDGDKRPDLVAMYRVQAYPTVILLSPAGVPLKDLTGGVDPDGFLNWLHSPASP